MAPTATTTGRTSRYGAAARSARCHVKGRRRRGHEASAAIAVLPGTWLLVTELRRPVRHRLAVQDRLDVVPGRRRRLLDRELAGQDLRQHVPQDIAVLDVDPLLRRRDEPAAHGS